MEIIGSLMLKTLSVVCRFLNSVEFSPGTNHVCKTHSKWHDFFFKLQIEIRQYVSFCHRNLFAITCVCFYWFFKFYWSTLSGWRLINMKRGARERERNSSADKTWNKQNYEILGTIEKMIKSTHHLLLEQQRLEASASIFVSNINKYR